MDLHFLPPAFAEQSSSASGRAEAFSAHHSEQRPFTFYTETGHSAYAVEQCTPAFEASASVFPSAPVDDLVWFLQVEQRMPTTTQQLLQRVAAIEALVPVDHHKDQHYHLICSSHEATTATTSRVDSTTQLSTTPPTSIVTPEVQAPKRRGRLPMQTQLSPVASQQPTMRARTQEEPIVPNSSS